MMQFLSVLGKSALMAVVTLLLYVLALTLRNPAKPKWLDVDGIAVLAALAITAALTLAFSAFVNSLIMAGTEFPLALIAGVVLWAAVSTALWALLRMSDRLKACETGRSPFRLKEAMPER